jgi:hypothetical protein
MDNQAYLDQIAVKGKVKSGPILTPFLIKIIAAGIITLITMIIVGSVINASSAKVTQSYERVYVTINTISNEESPFRVYLEKVKDSNLRSYITTLLSSLRTTGITLEGIAPNVGINANAITPAVRAEDDANFYDLDDSLRDAFYTGTLDRTYAAKAYYEISLLLSYEEAARSKTPNQEFANLLDQSISDLKTIQEQFKAYNENN